MPRGGTTDYEVIIPVKVRDETSSGTTSAQSSVNKMLNARLDAIEKANDQQVADARKTSIEIFQIESNMARREIAERERDLRDIQKIHDQKVRMAQKEASQTAASQEKAMREALADIKRMETERARIMASNDKIIERQEQQSYQRRVRNAEIAAKQQANAFLQQAEKQSAAAGGGGLGAAGLGFLGGAAAGAAAFALAEITSLTKQGAEAWIDYASTLQNAKIAFTVFLGSADAAESHLNELKKFALVTPFQFKDLVEASQLMQAMGFEAKQVVPLLNDIGNAVAAAGGGADRLQRVVYALSEVQAQGKLTGKEIRQLANNGIPVMKMLQEEFGVTAKEARKMAEEGQITSDKFLVAFGKFSQLHFGDLMQKQVRTFTGAMSNIQDVLLQTADKAFGPLFERISQIASKTSEELQKTANLSGVADKLADAFTELGGMLAEKLVEGLGASLARGETYAFLVKNFTGLFFLRLEKAFVDEAAKSAGGAKGLAVWLGDKFFMLGGRAIDMNNELAGSQHAVSVELEMTKDESTKLTAAMNRQTVAVREQRDAMYGLKDAMDAYEQASTHMHEPKFEVLPEKLKEAAAALSHQLKVEAAAISGFGSLFELATPEQQQDAMKKAILARRQDLGALSKDIRETTAALSGPGGASKAYNDFIKSLGDPTIQNALKQIQVFEKSIKDADQASQKAEEARKKRLQEFQKLNDSLTARLGEVTQKHKELNAEVGKAPDALKEYDLWWAKVSQKEKDLIANTPALNNVLTQLREETERFSADQAEHGMADLMADVNTELGRYVDGAREADTASEKLRAKFDATGLMARASKESITAFMEALDQLSKKEKAAAEEKARIKREELQKDTMQGIQGLGIDLDRFISGRSETRVEQLVHSLTELKGLDISTDAFEPLSKFIRQVVDKPQGLAAAASGIDDLYQALRLGQMGPTDMGLTNLEMLSKILGNIVRTAPGIDPSKVNEVTSALQHLLLTTAQLDTPQGRAFLRVQDETKNLRDQLEESQQEIALVSETSALRMQLAYQRAYNEIVLADEAARESQIQSQVKLADATVIHTEQIRAQVMDHMASQVTLTQAMGNAIVGIYDKVASTIDRGIDKLGHGLSFVNDMLKAIAHQLLNKVFQFFLGGSGGPGQAGYPSQQGGPLGGGILNFFGGGRATPPTSLTSITGGGPAPGGGGITDFFRSIFPSGSAPSTLTAAASESAGAGMLPIAATPWDKIWPAIGGQGGAGAPGLAQALSLKGLGMSIASMAPLLGLGLGASLGGSSLTGQLLGGAGGLLAGGAIGAFTGTGIFATGGVAAAGGSLSWLPALLTNPFTIGIAGALIVGAIIARKNAQRRKDETLRASLNESVVSQVSALLSAAQTGEITSISDAQSRFNEIHQSFLSQVATMKDGKTKKIATDWWDHDLAPAYWPKIVDAVNNYKADQVRAGRIVPEFETGGNVLPFRGRVPGGSKSSMLIRVHGDEAVINPSQIDRLGGPRALARAGVPGFSEVSQMQSFDTGGMFASGYVPAGTWNTNFPKVAAMAPVPLSQTSWVPSQTAYPSKAPTQPAAEDSSPIVVNLELGIDINSGELFVKGATTAAGRKVLVQVTKQAVKDRAA